MLLPFCVLGVMASLNGGGGLTAIYNQVANEGYSYSKYRVGKCLEELASIGAITKTGKTFMLTLLGANLVAADIAAANGWEVIHVNEYMQMPSYKKGLK